MLAKFIESVKGQIEYWQYMVAHFGPDHPRFRPAQIAKYQYLIRDFTELLEYLERQAAQESVENPAPVRPQRYQQPVAVLRQVFAAPRGFEEPSRPTLASGDIDMPDDLADLPPELLSELSESIKGETDPLIKIINGRGGTATLDEILIDLWRKYKELGKRPIVSNKLYRLSRRGLCWSLPGKKGIYTTTKPAGGDGTPPTEDDDGHGAPDTSSKEPAASAIKTKTVSSKARRELFASTAIPPNRMPN